MKHLRGMVVSAHRLASEAGTQVLRKGGNAVDAAVATGLTLGVAEPAFSGIGGGGFALIHLASGEKIALDYRETAPLAATERMFSRAGKSSSPGANSIGPLAVATPGMVSGYARMLETYGTLKFRDVAKYAVEAAKSGTSLPRLSEKIISTDTLGSLTKLRRFDGSARAFLGGTKAKPSLARRMPLLAKTLSALAREGPETFYHEDIPEAVSTYLKESGGIISERDFEQYAMKVRRPAKGEFAGLEVLSMPPPSAGGTLLIQGLMMVDRLREDLMNGSEARRLALLSRVLRSILDQRGLFGDPDFVHVDTRNLLSDSYVDAKVKGALSDQQSSTQTREPDGVGSTSHYCVVDSSGNVVSATETIECYFGSGVTVPSLGVLLNDEMHDFDVAPGRPNSIHPGKRPASSMSPTILLKDGESQMVIGGAGSERIITSILQVIFNVAVRGMKLGDSLSEPRIHATPTGAYAELGIGKEALSAMNRAVGKVAVRGRLDPYFGGVQAIVIDPKKGAVVGGADPRRMGVAVSE